jgi:hypothetical protein
MWNSMIFDQVTDTQMRAASVLGGATMAGFLAAPMFRTRAPIVRMVVAGVYFAGVLGFTAYVLAR